MGLRGCQEPRLSLIPPYTTSLGQQAVELAAVAGLILDPWQQFVLINSLGLAADGRWAAFEVGLIVARQNGKDSILEAMEIAGLFVLGDRLIIHSAHKFDTAMEHLERLANLIEAAALQKRIRKINRSHGSEGITLKDGRRIRFRARTTSGGGRGYTGDRVIFNEAMDLPDSIVGAMMPTMAARSALYPGPQIIYAGSAVDQETMANGLVLSRIREAGIAGVNKRLAYFEWSAEDDADPHSIEARRAANPGMGYRITPEYIETEFQSPAMSSRQFAVERLGVGDWFDTSGESGRVISREAWAAIAEPQSVAKPITSAPMFALDSSPDNSWSAIAIAGRRDDALPQFMLVDHERGTDWLAERCESLQGDHPDASFVVDVRGPAAHLIDDLKRRGVRVLEANTEDYGTACGQFYDAVVNDNVRYPSPQPELDEALTAARAATLGDRWKWARRTSTSPDISPLVAVTLALWGAMNAGSEYATVLYGSDSISPAEDPEIGPAYHQIGMAGPRVISQEESTSCFACRVGGCTIHTGGS